MKKRILSIALALVMVLGMLPVQVLAASDLSWSGGTINLAAGTKIGSYELKTLQIYNKNATSTYPTIVAASQEGSTINITLAEGTDPSYPIQMGFAGDGAVIMHSGNTCTLKNGKGSASVTVQAKAAPAPNAHVYGQGTFTVNFTVIMGESYSVTAPEGEGFTFSGSDTVFEGSDYSFGIAVDEAYDGSAMTVKVNGETVSGTNGSYTVSDVKSDLVITVEGLVKKEVCSITAPEGEGFTFTGAASVYKGESYSFTLAVDSAYKGDAMVVKANGEVLSGESGSYTIAAVNEDTVITVEGVVKKQVYTVTLTEGAGYTISGQATSYEGEPYTFTVTLDDALYKAADTIVKVNGEAVTLADGKYTIASLDSDTVVTVENVTERALFTVTKPEMEFVTVSGEDSVREGKDYSFTVELGVIYDGTNMLVKVNGETISAAEGVYTVSAVGENLSITVEGLVKKDAYTVTAPAEGKKFSFSGDEIVFKGETYTFTVETRLGYTAIVKVNGETVSGTDGSYAVENVSENLVITVDVQRMAMPEPQLPEEDNVIDITDKTFASYSSNRYWAKAATVSVSGADVLEAYEEGTNVYIIVSRDTADDAAISVTVNCETNRYTVSGNTGNVQLSDGDGIAELKLTGKYNNMSVGVGTVTYNIVVFRELPPTEVPVCIKSSDSGEVWKGHPLQINLKNYFKDAQKYYVFDGGKVTTVEGNVYTYVPDTAGEHTLVFSAENEIGMCGTMLLFTVNVKDIEGGIYIGHTTSNGSLDSVKFTDADGNLIEGLKVAYSNKTVTVTLPKDYPIDGSVKAVFSLTQNGEVPFITTKTGTSGTTSGKAVNNKFTEKTSSLSGGAAVFTFYYYNTTPTNTSNNYETWSLVYKMANDLPALAEGVEATASHTMTAGETFELDLRPIFTDADGDALSYLVSVNSAADVAADADYSFTTDVAGTYTLVFSANDTKGTSEAAYTVTLTVENVKEKDSMSVSVPEGLEIEFYVSPGFEEGIDQKGDSVEAVKGETADGMTVYTLSYPQNAAMLGYRTVAWGGMAFPAEKDGAISLRKLCFSVTDYNEDPAESSNSVSYGENKAVSGENGWLLVAGKEYSFKAEPVGNAELAAVTEKMTLEAGAELYTLELMLNIKDPVTITAPTGAEVHLYKHIQYYANTELDAKIVRDNDDGTTSHYFIADVNNQQGTAYIYYVTLEGKITKAGYIAWNQKNINISISDEDKSSAWRLSNYSGTGQDNSDLTEDSVLLNINSRNHLSLSVGQTKTLKAYRAWEIIPRSYNNYIISPNFHYTVLYGSDVVSLTEKKSASAGTGDWMTLTALKAGVAVIEVTYDAIEISGGDIDGEYGASDPARSGIVVVQVGGSNDSSVNFGIECFASVSSAGSSNVPYNPNNKKAWDAEFDTLYFTGSGGELKLSPTAASAITEVAVSHDKGGSWTVLSGNDGTYTAPIVSGNNIIRVKTAAGTAYQVVRGDRISVTYTEVEGKSDGDGTIEAGETVRVRLIGLHNPIPKMAGNYNPGYGGNTDGYGKQHLNYSANGEAVWGPGSQYNFINVSNYVDVVMPEDGSDLTLSDGYIGLGNIGLTTFADGGDSHRNIPDAGCSTRGTVTTWHTRSILPEITLESGSEAAANSAPTVRSDAVSEGSIYSDQNFALNPELLFDDPDGNTLSFTVSVDGGETEAVGVDYKFTPGKVGTFKLAFTASDGKLSASHTVTVTVTERPQEEEKDDKFGLSESEIAGYVTVSFEDFGVRVEGEKGLKYPVPLGVIIAPTQVPFKQGENIAQVTKRLLDHLNIGMSYSGSLTGNFYLGAISNFEVGGTPYGSMAEFDAGEGSGWMITLNGVFINRGASDFTVKNGDVVKWQYTCQYGADIGDTSYFGSVTDVIKLINAIGEVTAESGDKIKAAREAYNKLSATDKDRVSNYAKLTAAEEAYAKLLDKAVDELEKAINALGNVTLDSKEKIEAARKAYDALPYAYKQKVENYTKLADAEKAYEELKKADDSKKAAAVEELIDKLDENSFTFEEDVKAAKAAYDKLSADQKKLVDNYAKLTAALKALADEESREAAEKVEKLIRDIGTVGKDSEEKIKAAREAYEKLSEEEKALVENLAVLEAAEEKLEDIKALADVEAVYKATGDYLKELGTPSPGSVGGEWMVIGLLRSGRDVEDIEAYYEAAVKFVQDNADENERLHRAKSTENSRMILALTAMGADVSDVGGHDLLKGLGSMDYIRTQGINGPIWALIALDSGNYPVPEGDVSREGLIREILDAQLDDGGWALSGGAADADMTGMALQALAPYYDSSEEVAKAVDRAVFTLSIMQNSDGSYGSIDGVSSESIAQVIAGLSALGIDPHMDARFAKNGITALDALCAFFVEGGGFKHTPEGGLDGMATEQSYYALTAYFRMLDGKSALFDMTDVVDVGGDPVAEEEKALPAEQETTPAPAQPEELVEDEGRSFPIWLVIVIVVLAGAVIVLAFTAKPKKRGR